MGALRRRATEEPTCWGPSRAPGGSLSDPNMASTLVTDGVDRAFRDLLLVSWEFWAQPSLGFTELRSQKEETIGKLQLRQTTHD